MTAPLFEVLPHDGTSGERAYVVCCLGCHNLRVYDDPRHVAAVIARHECPERLPEEP